MDLSLHALTAATSIGLWEAAKLGAGAMAKRYGDQKDGKRKVLRDDLGAAGERISACMEHALEYFSDASDRDRRKELSRSIRHEIQTLATALHGVNVGLCEIGQRQLEASKIITFRQSLTLHLDSVPPIAMGVDDPRITAMYRAGHHLSMALMHLKYKAT